jgi:hypothetical protein
MARCTGSIGLVFFFLIVDCAFEILALMLGTIYPAYMSFKVSHVPPPPPLPIGRAKGSARAGHPFPLPPPPP